MSFTPAEIIGPIGGFVVLAALALALVFAVLRAAGRAVEAGDNSSPASPERSGAGS